MAGRLIRAARLVWVAGFGVGAATHLVDLAADGVQVYADQPAAVRAFWVSLALWDPLVVALVLLRRRAGVVLGVAVMVADVAVNGAVLAAGEGGSPRALATLVVFGAVVLATAVPLARWFTADLRRGANPA